MFVKICVPLSSRPTHSSATFRIRLVSQLDYFLLMTDAILCRFRCMIRFSSCNRTFCFCHICFRCMIRFSPHACDRTFCFCHISQVKVTQYLLEGKTTVVANFDFPIFFFFHGMTWSFL
eukprot:Rmarinus@m.13457